MITFKKIAVGGAVAWALFAATGGAAAMQETGAETYRYVDQVSDLSCQDGYQAWQSEICTGAQLRWRLCALGFGAEALPSPEIYQCFVRSQ